MTASMTVKGIERVNRRSDSAKLKMKMFLAVLISFLQIEAIITLTFPGTASFNHFRKYLGKKINCSYLLNRRQKYNIAE